MWMISRELSWQQRQASGNLTWKSVSELRKLGVISKFLVGYLRLGELFNTSKIRGNIGGKIEIKGRFHFPPDGGKVVVFEGWLPTSDVWSKKVHQFGFRSTKNRKQKQLRAFLVKFDFGFLRHPHAIRYPLSLLTHKHFIWPPFETHAHIPILDSQKTKTSIEVHLFQMMTFIGHQSLFRISGALCWITFSLIVEMCFSVPVHSDTMEGDHLWSDVQMPKSSYFECE